MWVNPDEGGAMLLRRYIATATETIMVMIMITMIVTAMMRMMNKNCRVLRAIIIIIITDGGCDLANESSRRVFQFLCDPL